MPFSSGMDMSGQRSSFDSLATGAGLGADRPTTRFEKYLEATANEVMVTGDERMRSALIYAFGRNGFVPDACYSWTVVRSTTCPEGLFT